VAEALLIAAVEGAGTQLYWAKDVFNRHLGSEDRPGGTLWPSPSGGSGPLDMRKQVGW
jgi:hypothetical protein